MKRNKNIEHYGPHTINTKWLGEFNAKTEGVVIDKVVTKEGKIQLKPQRTENIELLAGESTVAVFHIKGRSKKVFTQ